MSEWVNSQYRIIEFENNCEHPIGVVTTRPDDMYMPCSQICDSEFIKGGIIMDNGKQSPAGCKNYKQIISAVPSGGSNIYIEELCKGTNDLRCGTSSDEYCSSSTKFYPVELLEDEFRSVDEVNISKTRKNEISTLDNITLLQEATFGADPDSTKKATDDNFDASVIPPGPCSAHSNPFSNQYGYSLDSRSTLNDGRGCVKPINSVPSFNPDVSFQIKDFRDKNPLPNLYSGKLDNTSIVGPACNRQSQGACEPDTSWVCGEPYQYNYKGNDYWLVKYSCPDPSCKGGNEWTIYNKEPDSTIMYGIDNQPQRIQQHEESEVPQPLRDEIKKDIRENIYKCTLNTYLTLNQDKSIDGLTTPIGANFSTYDDSVHNNPKCAPMNCSSSKYLDIFDNCNFSSISTGIFTILPLSFTGVIKIFESINKSFSLIID